MRKRIDGALFSVSRGFPVSQLGGQLSHLPKQEGKHLQGPLLGKSEFGAGYADGGDHIAKQVADWRGDSMHPLPNLEATDEEAKLDQQRRIDEHGGKDYILNKGFRIAYTPAPQAFR